MPLNKAQMQQSVLTCSNRVGGGLQCQLYNGFYIKHGKTGAGKQRYKCKGCSKTCIDSYSNKACITSNISITALLVEGCGIRSIARLLCISNTTVLKHILLIAKNMSKPAISVNKAYEVTRLLWIAYAVQIDTRRIADFAIGSRTKATLQNVISTLCLRGASKIYTDNLHLYSLIIPSHIHCSKQYNINHIERKNLSLRTHLKRLSGRTICFSKSMICLLPV
jgi:insertion element IS1 protein InsB